MICWFIICTGSATLFSQPSFDINGDVELDEKSSAVSTSLPNWATNISDGGSGLPLSFILTQTSSSSNLTFTEPVEVSSDGILSFQIGPYANGTTTYDIYLTDNTTNSSTQSFSIVVNKVNFPPTGIFLSNQEVLEHQPINTLVGAITGTDPDPEDILQFSFGSGAGGEFNGSFSMNNDELFTAEVFDEAIKNRYQIKLLAFDGEFTFEQNFVILITIESAELNFANAFTPNNDGENDTWIIENIEQYPSAGIYIYDDSGQKVFISEGAYEPWDGTRNGKPVPMGTYFYVINLNDGGSNISGTLTIIL